MALDANAVLRLRALVALQVQALERSRDGYAGGTLVLTIDGLRLLVHALREWSPRREELGFLRAQEAIDVPLVDGMIDDLSALHVRALQCALGAPTSSYALG